MDFSDRIGATFRQYLLPIVLGVVGIVFLLYGLIQSVLPHNAKEDVVFESANAEGVETKDSKTSQITIDIEGAVLKPGVYQLQKDARVQDALIQAGGMSDRADREKVAKGLNLAAKVTDGGKIYIPFMGEEVSAAQANLGSGTTQSVAGDSTSSLININSATSSELDTLTGVGPATAEKIISSRPYEKIEDLVSKKAVGQSVFEKIKDRISVY